MRQKSVVALGLAVLLVATACTPAPIVNIPSASSSLGAVPLVVGIPQVPDGTVPSEGKLLANVYAAALNAAGVDASVAKNPFKNGELVSGLESGSFDIVPVFSRLALSETVPEGSKSPDAAEMTPGEVLAALKKSLPEDVLQLDASKVDEHENIVVTAVTAEKHQLKTMADAAKICDQLAMGGTAGFKMTAPGLSELALDYGCVPKTYESLLPSLNPNSDSIFWALLQDKVQLAVIPSSSPAIVDNSLVVLNDSKQLFSVQTVVPLVAAKKVDGDVQTVLNKVSAVLTIEELGDLNRLSQDRHYGDVAEVAKAWLIQKGLVKASS